MLYTYFFYFVVLENNILQECAQIRNHGRQEREIYFKLPFVQSLKYIFH